MDAPLLLIEDDELSIYTTCKLLADSGFCTSIDVVRDGREAMSYLSCEVQYAGRKTGNPALILLDLKLPDYDGLELFKSIRSHPSFALIPVFILSASRSEEDMYRSALLGVAKFLTKPLDALTFDQEAGRVFVAPRLH